MEISKENIHWKIETLEKGLSSSVFLYTAPSGKQYIAKKSPLSRLKFEFSVLSSLDHPNILKVFGCVDPTDKQFMMMSEFCEKGDMVKFLETHNSKILTKEKILNGDFEKFWRSVFVSILDALLYIKEKNLAHLDIKPENLLMTSNFSIKMCDFEYIFPANSDDGQPFLCNFVCGTEAYFSPEIKEKKIPYDPVKSEIFSFGVSILNMVTGGQIFVKDAVTSDKRYEFIRNDDFAKFWSTIKLARFLSNDFKDLLEKMMKYDAEKRLDFNGIMRHLWVNQPTLSKEQIMSFF